MTRTSKIILSTTLALGLIGGGAAYAKYRFANFGHYSEHMIEHVSDELDLNATQEQSLRTLVDELVTLKTGMKRNFRGDRKLLLDMIAEPIFNQARALDMLDAKTMALRDNAPAVVAAFGTFLDGLNAEQKAEIMERIDRHKGRHHGEQRWFEHDDDKD